MRIYIIIKNTLLIICIIVCFQCSNKKKNDLVELNYILDSIIIQQYNEFKTIEGSSIRFRIDSVYLIGNELIKNIGDDDFEKRYVKFCHEYGEGKFGSDLNHNKEYLKAKIKLMQLNYINQDIQCFYQSHFQVDLLGLQPLNKKIKKDSKEKIQLIPHFLTSEIESPPIVIIDGDTLKYDGLYYEYNYNQSKIGLDTIKPDIIIKRWGDTIRIKCGFTLDVE
ncbi:MAG: hypothetical protein PHC83_05070 [Bacteroidales bacterium]|nr:hypothetical protein [Bacteroidales bacterium]MDD4209675.1 hypothetical protein [Bacteroidales bacterium]